MIMEEGRKDRICIEVGTLDGEEVDEEEHCWKGKDCSLNTTCREI